MIFRHSNLHITVLRARVRLNVQASCGPCFAGSPIEFKRMPGIATIPYRQITTQPHTVHCTEQPLSHTMEDIAAVPFTRM